MIYVDIRGENGGKERVSGAIGETTKMLELMDYH